MYCKIGLILLAIALSLSPLNAEESIQDKTGVYSYDGEVNPNDFFNWTAISLPWSCEARDGSKHFHLFILNPNHKNHPVKVVKIRYIHTEVKGTIVISGYEYSLNGKRHTFMANGAKHFEEIIPETKKKISENPFTAM